MYQFFIQNYNGGNQAYIQEETLVYSVPILNTVAAFTDPAIKVEMGKAGSLEFSLNPTHPYFSAFRKMQTLVRAVYDGTTIFRGRVLTIDNNNLWGERKIHAEGDLAFLLDSQIEGQPDDDRPIITALQYLSAVIFEHNRKMSSEPWKQFVLGEVPGQYTNATDESQRVKTDSRKFGSSSWQTAMSCLENLQKTFGGFFRTRYENGLCYLDWLESYFRASDTAQPLAVTQNLLEISDTEDVNNLFTVLIPVGTFESKPLYLPGKEFPVPDVVNYCTNAELNNGYHSRQDYLNAFNDHGWIYKVEQFRDAETESELRAAARDYILHNYVGGTKNFSITALDLHHMNASVEKLLVGDQVPVIYPDADHLTNGHSGRITKNLTIISASFYPHGPDANEYTVGVPNSQMSKDYGSSANKKLSNSSSAKAGSAFSGISSLNNWADSFSKDTFDVKKITKSYEDLAWTFVLDRFNEYYDHHNRTELTSHYPNAETDFQYSKIGWTMIHNKMSTGQYGSFEYGYFNVDATGSQIKISIRKGVEATQELKIALPYLQAYLQSLKSGYEAYAAAHPGWPEDSASEMISTLLDGNGLNFLSTDIGSLLLPEGLDILGTGGSGFDISGASSIVTGLLGKIGLPIPGQDQYKEVDLMPGDNPRTLGYYEWNNNAYIETHDDRGVSGKIYYVRIPASNTLTEFDMQKVLNLTSPLGAILDTAGKFSLDKLKNLLPKDLKDAIVNNAFTQKATDWLCQKFPILKYILGAGQTTLSISGIEDFVNGIPLFAPETLAGIFADSGAISGSTANIGNGAATISNTGTVSLTSPIMALLDENHHVTQESLLKVFPRLHSSFVSGASELTLTTAGSNHVIKKFPELSSLVNSSHRLTLSAIETYLTGQISEGKLKATSNPTVELDPKSGSINGSKVNLGADATGSNKTVMIDGESGVLKTGKDSNDNWLVTINEPITYTDDQGVSHTLQGAIRAQDISLPDIPSFKTKFAYIETLVSQSIHTGDLEAIYARIGTLESTAITATTLDAEVADLGYVKAEDLYVSGAGQFAGYIKADRGVMSSGPVSATSFISDSITLRERIVMAEEFNETPVYTYFANGKLSFGGISKQALLQAPVVGDGPNFYIGLQAQTNNDGTITISFVDNTDREHDSANFNIADTQAYRDGVSAAYSDAANRVVWPTTPRNQSSFSIQAPDSTWNAAAGTGTSQNRIFALSYGQPDSNNVITVNLTMSHNENGSAVTDGVVAKIDVPGSDAYSQGYSAAEHDFKPYDVTVSIAHATINYSNKSYGISAPVYVYNQDSSKIATITENFSVNANDAYEDGRGYGWSESANEVDLLGRKNGSGDFTSIRGQAYASGIDLSLGDYYEVKTVWKTGPDNPASAVTRTIRAPSSGGGVDISSIKLYHYDTAPGGSENGPYEWTSDMDASYFPGYTVRIAAGDGTRFSSNTHRIYFPNNSGGGSSGTIDIPTNQIYTTSGNPPSGAVELTRLRNSFLQALDDNDYVCFRVDCGNSQKWYYMDPNG